MAAIITVLGVLVLISVVLLAPLRARITLDVIGLTVSAEISMTYAGVSLPKANADARLDRGDVLRAGFGKKKWALSRSDILAAQAPWGDEPPIAHVQDLLRAARIESIRFFGILGTGNAALTAHAASLAIAVIAPLFAAVSSRVRSASWSVIPDFSQTVFRCNASCIFSIRPAQVIHIWIRNRRKGD